MIRKSLYKKFKDMGFRLGAEIGVRDGTNAVNMFECIPGVKLYLIDPWHKIKKYNAEEAYKKTISVVSKYENVVIRRKSEYAVREFNDGYFDFVYIDGDHSYDSVMLDIILWIRKIRPGGIISGHDYRKSRKMGVKQAVDDYVRYHNLNLKLSAGRNWFWET